MERRSHLGEWKGRGGRAAGQRRGGQPGSAGTGSVGLPGLFRLGHMVVGFSAAAGLSQWAALGCRHLGDVRFGDLPDDPVLWHPSPPGAPGTGYPYAALDPVLGGMDAVVRGLRDWRQRAPGPHRVCMDAGWDCRRPPLPRSRLRLVALPVTHPRERLDEVIHQPVRFSITAALAAADALGVSFVRDVVNIK